jgi:putative FmdB family regulatory protein
VLYTYKCENCHTEQDIFTSIADKDNHVCKECGKKLEQIDTYATAFQFKGKLRHY